MKLRLKAKTHKAKNRIKENGDVWHVVCHGRPTTRPEFPLSFFVQAREGELDSDHRWINEINDPDFEIVEVIP